MSRSFNPNESARSLRQARRIIVVGSPGAGKTNLARRIATLTRLPLFSLDDLYWERSWTRPTTSTFNLRHGELLRAASGIIDGNYFNWLAARVSWSDTILFLDVPTLTALAGVLCRSAVRKWGYSGDLPERVRIHGNCAQEPLDLAFLRFVLRFRTDMRPRMLELFNEAISKVAVEVGARGPRITTCGD